MAIPQARMKKFLADDVLAADPASAMAIYAHPDDPEVSCGGALARWAAAGADAARTAPNRILVAFISEAAASGRDLVLVVGTANTVAADTYFDLPASHYYCPSSSV